MADNYNSQWTGEQIDEAVGLARQGSIITGAEATTLAAGSEATATVENNVLKIGVPKGADGKSAYKSAQDGGYTGTETQFNTDLAEVSSKVPREWALNNGVKTITLRFNPIMGMTLSDDENKTAWFDIGGVYVVDAGLEGSVGLEPIEGGCRIAGYYTALDLRETLLVFIDGDGEERQVIHEGNTNNISATTVELGTFGYETFWDEYCERPTVMFVKEIDQCYLYFQYVGEGSSGQAVWTCNGIDAMGASVFYTAFLYEDDTWEWYRAGSAFTP